MTQAAPADSQDVRSRTTVTTSARKTAIMSFIRRLAHRLPGALSAPAHYAPAAHLVAEEFGAGPEHVGEEAFQQALKALPVRRRDAVPRLGSTAVHVVHACQVHVLSVPAHGVEHARCLFCMRPNGHHMDADQGKGLAMTILRDYQINAVCVHA